MRIKRLNVPSASHPTQCWKHSLNVLPACLPKAAGKHSRNKWPGWMSLCGWGSHGHRLGDFPEVALANCSQTRTPCTLSSAISSTPVLQHFHREVRRQLKDSRRSPPKKTTARSEMQTLYQGDRAQRHHSVWRVEQLLQNPKGKPKLRKRKKNSPKSILGNNVEKQCSKFHYDKWPWIRMDPAPLNKGPVKAENPIFMRYLESC